MDKQHLLDTYGNPDANNDGILDLEWTKANLQVFDLPFPMRLSWDTSTVIKRFQAHRLAGRYIFGALQAIVGVKNLAYLRENKLDYWGGCFNFRPMRNGRALSMHAWGIAVDINPQIGRYGSHPDADVYPQFIVKAFKDEGFIWGGDWDYPDAMHMELAQ
jgi:hypothetical protein